MKTQKIQTGIAGELWVASKLAELGHIVSLTPKNSPLVDIYASNISLTRTVAISVKTRMANSKGLHLDISKCPKNTNNFYYVYVLMDAINNIKDFYVFDAKYLKVQKAQKAYNPKTSDPKNDWSPLGL